MLNSFRDLLIFVGEDPTREGLIGTPKRMSKMWLEITSGYTENPESYFTTFKENAESYDQLVILSPIKYYSMCEHHLLPFFGNVHIGYIPDKKIVGISKLARLVKTYSRRLQIQERLVDQIGTCIVNNLKPLGVGVVITGEHLCMSMRGIESPGTVTTTSFMNGVMATNSKARGEFLSLVQRNL